MKKVILIVTFIILLIGCQTADNQDSINKTIIQESSLKDFIEEHADLEIVYTLVADINGDYKPESFLVSGKSDPKLWYIDNNGKGSVIIDANGCSYLSTELVDRGKEKHIAFMGFYEPSNTNLWVIRMEEGIPKIVFEFMADWEIRISQDRFDMTWKDYNSNAEEGGYDLVVDKYFWDEKQSKYIKE